MFSGVDDDATTEPGRSGLDAGLRTVVGQWEVAHGYRSLRAESFSDPESHAGTVCKATNRVQAGVTKGGSYAISKAKSTILPQEAALTVCKICRTLAEQIAVTP